MFFEGYIFLRSRFLREVSIIVLYGAVLWCVVGTAFFVGFKLFILFVDSIELLYHLVELFKVLRVVILPIFVGLGLAHLKDALGEV